MGSAPRIAIDAMGGDSGPAVMVAGAAIAFDRRDDLELPPVRRRDARSASSSPSIRASRGVAEIVHCDDVISGDDKPSQAIRRAKTSSMGRAIAAVKDGEAAGDASPAAIPAR